MKYSNWYDRMIEKHGDLTQSCIDECLNPDVRDFLNHQCKEYQKAAEADAIDYRYKALLEWTEKAEAALEDGKPDVIAMAFCQLGQAINELEGLSPKEIDDLYQAALDGHERKITDLKRQRPTLEKQGFIKHAQDVAAKLWANDTGQAIRLADMCERVYKLLMPIESEWGRSDLLPNDSAGLKPWLRKIAPAYATKRGRPRKTNM